MIHKVVHIKNIGKFKNYNSGSDTWNGIFKKITAIYAENGSGKTTFTQIIKSLQKDNPEIINKRKSLGSKESISITFIDDIKKPIIFNTI